MPQPARIEGMKEFQAAIRRNPKVVLKESKKFLVRGIAEYNKGIIRKPWRIDGSGGGAPVSNDPRYKRAYQRQRSGNLRDSHQVKIQALKALIGPTQAQAPYAAFVHGGTSKLQARPWLDFVRDKKQREIQKLYRILITTVTKDLAR